jgi:DnaJ homologue, subfamily C, member 28, conserved domain
VPYESWVDRQIREAIERGEFDNLPGRGKPIKGLNGRDDENWWVKAYLEREQLPLPLPTALALRKEVKALPETLADIADEASYARSSPISTTGSQSHTGAGLTVRRSSSGSSTWSAQSPSGGAGGLNHRARSSTGSGHRVAVRRA